jgi:hypothetical protein
MLLAYLIIFIICAYCSLDNFIKAEDTKARLINSFTIFSLLSIAGLMIKAEAVHPAGLFATALIAFFSHKIKIPE